MTVHTFHPTTWYNTLGSHPPALRVADGDTIETWTIDSRANDKDRNQVALPPNPMTGPFYVEGAAPGDALEVIFHAIVPSREWAWTSNQIAPNTIDPAMATTIPGRGLVDWVVDTETMTAALKSPPAALAGVQVALKPYFGCFGVAPPLGQAFSTATSAENGGNMDYNGFAAATSVLFPVFAEGALFHLGDGHAVQGDGEINGTGLEISMRVTFTLKVHKGKKIGWPRGFTETHIFAVGNARPLDQALQHATSEMVSWLAADYGLTFEEASIFLGQVVEYDVANVFNPAYSVACKVPKSALEMLSK